MNKQEFEIWKDIEGFEGLYQVSNLGNVKSLRYHNNSKWRYGSHSLPYVWKTTQPTNRELISGKEYV